MKLGGYKEKYRRYRKGHDDILVLEGLHAVKHALRFKAEIIELLYVDEKEFINLENNILKEYDKKNILAIAKKVDESFFNELLPYRTRSRLIALAKKPKYNLSKITNGPIVFLEEPTNPENIGMALRVVSAFGISAFVVSGRVNPFSASVLRAGAGLLWATPTFHLGFQDLVENKKGYQIISADADGKSIYKIKIDKNSIIVFGTERYGISKEIKEVSNKIVSLPMKEGVSSLNLATSVSAFLYGGKFDIFKKIN